MIEILAAEEIVQVGVPASVITGVLVWIGKDFLTRRKNGKKDAGPVRPGALCPDHGHLIRKIDEVIKDVKDVKEGQVDMKVNIATITAILKERHPD